MRCLDSPVHRAAPARLRQTADHAATTTSPASGVENDVRLHLTKPLREFIKANSHWLTVFQLPTHASDLIPTEGVWSHVNRDLGNLAAADLGQITRAV
ncbi:transposase [Streptomyces sp. OfavH-34-F]|uniref:transposase n=1 Tax=Streptomyces sp. OfavH-34-F TaxID=2917760 RepID=UPI0035B2CE86